MMKVDLDAVEVINSGIKVDKKELKKYINEEDLDDE